MDIIIRQYCEGDLPQMTEIWNEIIDEGLAFPQIEGLNIAAAADFFSAQSFVGVAWDACTNLVLGLYTMRPNNVGRCGHIANATYAVKSTARGLKIGEGLVTHSIEKGRALGFKIMQFNAVVTNNHSAIHLYEKLGFIRLGIIPTGFLLKNGTFEDIILYYRML